MEIVVSNDDKLKFELLRMKLQLNN